MDVEKMGDCWEEFGGSGSDFLCRQIKIPNNQRMRHKFAKECKLDPALMAAIFKFLSACRHNPRFVLGTVATSQTVYRCLD